MRSYVKLVGGLCLVFVVGCQPAGSITGGDGSMLSTTIGHPDFMRPSNTHGEDQGDQTVPDYRDFNSTTRTVKDIGAIER